jgi:crossover junction endodeoxyribonuclease RusA
VTNVYSLTLYGKRPISLNQERSAHFAVRVRDTKWWREGFADAAKAAGMPKLEACEIIVQPVLENRRWQDTGACFPSAKAAIDGLIDAEVIEDDTPDIVPTIAFKRPILGKQPGLKLTVIALESRVPGEEAVLGEQEPEVQVAASHARSKAGSKKASSRRRSPVSKSGR